MSLVLPLAKKQLFKHVLRAWYRLKYAYITTFPCARGKSRVKCSSDGQKGLTFVASTDESQTPAVAGRCSVLTPGCSLCSGLQAGAGGIEELFQIETHKSRYFQVIAAAN